MSPSGIGALDWTLLGVVVLIAVAWYLSYTAARLDRLHHKVQTSRAALDVQLVRRARAAIEAAEHLDPAAAMVVADAATRALSAGERADTAAARSARDPLEVPSGLEPVETDLTRVLQVAFAATPGPAHDPYAGEARRRLADACHRVQLARRFHNDAVAQAQRVRRTPVARWAHLAGRAPMPQMIEFDDAVPGPLAE